MIQKNQKNLKKSLKNKWEQYKNFNNIFIKYMNNFSFFKYYLKKHYFKYIKVNTVLKEEYK